MFDSSLGAVPYHKMDDFSPLSTVEHITTEQVERSIRLLLIFTFNNGHFLP